MPAQLKKCTWFINQGKAGWSETWYQGTTTSSQTALANMQAVTAFRQALLVNTATIAALRVSDESILGDSLVDFGPQGGGYPGQATAALQDTPGNALFCRGTVGSQRRAVIVRGLPDAWIQYDVNGNAVFTGFLKAFQAWAAALQAKSFGLRVVDPTAPRKVIQNVVIIPAVQGVGTPAQYAVEADGHGITSADQNNDASLFLVHAAKFQNPSINRANGHSLVNGRWQFQKIPDALQAQFPPANWLLLPSNPPAGVTLPGYISGGFVQLKVETFAPLDAITATTGLIAEKFGIRKTGRAFFVQRGRARVRRF